jgi:predicted homoserine dehydrogenase-like protein
VILVDTALAKRAAEGAAPIRVGMIGAGFMASGVLLQINTVHAGTIRVVAVANRTVAKAVQAYADAGQPDAAVCDSPAALARAIEAGRAAVTEDPMLVATSPHVDVVLEVTGAIEEAVGPVLAAIEHGKHVALMNPELDGTLGPLLKHKADRAGVVFTDVDGDQPGVQGNLYRFVKGLGVRPVLCGNIKGLQDPYRTPTTQKAFAERWGQKPHMVTSFADGTKVSFEQAVVANATGMTVAKRGCHGYTVEAGTPLM